MWNGFRKFIVTGLGLGYLPIAPGTWGSVGPVAIFLAAAWLSGGCWGTVSWVMAGVAAAASVGMVALGGFTQRAFGKSDPGRCSLDEWAGQAVTLLAVPLGGGIGGWLLAGGAGFVFFRAFDIIKPPPIRMLERLPRGWGILCDDLLAGVYANAAAQILLRLIIRL